MFIRECDRRVVPRFRCLVCKRTCSQQTFACTYYLKRPELLPHVAAGLVACGAHRQIGRSLGCAPSTVTRLTARLGRHALLVQVRLLDAIGGIREPIVYDDFETFVFAQDHPVGIGTAVGQRSWLVYGLEWAPHLQGGRKRARKRRGPGNEHRAVGAYRRAFSHMLDLLAPLTAGGRSLDVVTDGHPGYQAGLRHSPHRLRVRHRTYPNPSRGPKGSPRSAQARVRDRQMFAVDLVHKLLRHSQAHHKRETIAFARRLNALLERAFVFAVWRNLVKRRSERGRDPTTPAMRLGLADEPWSWSDVLGQRLFPWRVTVPRRWAQVYRRTIVTAIIGRNRPHTLARAY